MRTVSITIDRNFHIMNDDRFIMEKISQTVQLDENDLGFEHAAMDAARKQIEDNFRHAYPHIEEHLNFHVERQVDEFVYPPTEKSYQILFKDGKYTPKTQEQEDFLNSMLPVEEKINKGTLEEQIQSSSNLKELDEWKFIANSNPKLKEVFNQREKELINEGLK